MLINAGLTSRRFPAESHRHIPYGAFVTNERKLISDRRNPSSAERSAALNEQISRATKTNNARCMIALRYSDGECTPDREKYALTIEASAVATRPGFQPPYQALTTIATEKTTRRPSTTTFESKNAGIKARMRSMLRMATP